MKKTTKKEGTKLDKSVDLKPEKIPGELTKSMVLAHLNGWTRDIAIQFMATAKEKFKYYYKLCNGQKALEGGGIEAIAAKKAVLSSFSEIEPLIEKYYRISLLVKWIQMYIPG